MSSHALLRELQAAKGGVLFIDEAYELGKGPFGQEACTAIVAAMTDPKYAGLPGACLVLEGAAGQASSLGFAATALRSRDHHCRVSGGH